MICKMMCLQKPTKSCIPYGKKIKASKKQKEKIEFLLQDRARLIATIIKLKEEVDYLNNKHEGMT